MAELLNQAAAHRWPGPALVDDREAVTWSELDHRVNRWITLLREHRLAVGDRVALVTGNRRTTMEALLACLHAGLVAVPVSWRLTAAEIAHILADSGSRAVLADPAYAERAAAGAAQAGLRPALAAVVADHPSGALAPVEKLLAEVDGAEPAGQCGGSVMLYTSATTGRPKGVVTPLLRPGASLERFARTVAAVGETFGIPRGGRALLAGPWYHAAQVFFSLFPLLRGCGLVMRQRFDAAGTLTDLERERISLCHLVPTQFIRLLAVDGRVRDRFRPAALRRVWHGAAACPVEVKRRMIEWWGPVLVEYYAATEAGIVTMIDSHEWLARPGSVGRPVPPTQVTILGPDGNPLPPGQSGAVHIHRPAWDFRYHNAPGQTAAAYRGSNMFSVGDLGYLDDEGYLYLTGRSLDTIISGGVNIYPAEVEAALAGHPGVRDVAVFGVPDPEFGEQVMAVVELEPGAGLDEADVPELLDQHCRSRLAGFKRPRRYRVVPSLPREPTGKVSRQALRDRYRRR